MDWAIIKDVVYIIGIGVALLLSVLKYRPESKKMQSESINLQAQVVEKNAGVVMDYADEIRKLHGELIELRDQNRGYENRIIELERERERDKQDIVSFREEKVSMENRLNEMERKTKLYAQAIIRLIRQLEENRITPCVTIEEMGISRN